jgi:hypothetical protein
MFFLKKYVPPENELKNVELLTENSDISKYSEENLRSHSNLIDGQIKRRKLMIFLVAICLSIYGALEAVHFQYSSTYYQYFDLRITAPKAALIVSAMAGSFTIGRCVSTFIAIKVKPEIMIIYHFRILIIAMCVLFFGKNYITLIWIGNIIIG